MGGAVSTGQDNDDLIDNLLEASYIKTAMVERVFRAVDRGEYFLPGSRGNAYKDLAWKSGHLHISAPCIYSKVMEGLELKPGLSFLNLGSGTGYLSTMVGLILGSSGINHGIELHKDVIQYANRKLADFKRLSGAMDEYDFCEPQYIQGNCLCLISNGHRLYDRVYCGAACPAEYASYMKKLLKVGGILVMPLNDKLLQIKRVSQNSWEQESLLPVSFATLVLPQPDQPPSFNEFAVEPPSLQCLCRTLVRNILRKNIEMEHCPVKRTISSSNKAPKKKRAVKKIVVPLFDTDTSDDENRATAGRNRSRNTNRVSMNPLDNDQLLNFVLGTLDGSRRGFLRSYRRSQNNKNTDSNTSSSEVNKTDESEPMEVEFEDDNTRTEETGDNSKTSEQTKENMTVENDTNCTHEGEKRETKDSSDTDPVASEDSEMLDKDSNNKGKQDDINKNSPPPPSNNERDSSQNTDEGPSYFSVIHMPRSLVIDGVVITNVQAFSDVDEAMNDFINGPSGSESTQNNNGDAGTNKTSDTKVNTSSTQGSSESDNQKSTTELGTNNTKKTTQKKSNDGDNESESEFLCGDCMENEAPSSSKTKNKTSKSKDKSSRRKKFDSGLGDEIVESNMADSSSDEECDHKIKFVVKNSSDSDSEDDEDNKKDDDDDDGDNDTLKKNFRQGLMWTRIELNRQNSASGNSSDNDNEDSKTDSEEYRMYQSSFTVHMRNKIQKLPLPVMLKNFLNYNRDF